MSEFSLHTVHPTETKEVASLSARFITSFVIAFAGILSFAPFLAYFSR
jgi:hypothetical protein